MLEIFRQRSKHSLQELLSLPSLKSDCEYHLSKEPTKQELRLLPQRQLEVGVLRKNNGEWTIIQGHVEYDSSHEVIGQSTPISSKIEREMNLLAHSHPKYDNLWDLPNLPSGRDCILARNSAITNFIINPYGLVFFTGVKRDPQTEKEWHPIMGSTNITYQPLFRPTEENLKKFMLDRMGVIIVKKTWEELPEEKSLSAFAKEIQAIKA